MENNVVSIKGGTKPLSTLVSPILGETVEHYFPTSSNHTKQRLFSGIRNQRYQGHHQRKATKIRCRA